MNQDNLKILILEDQGDDVELIVRELRRAGINFTSLRAESREDFLRLIVNDEPHLILSDYALPGFSGLDAVKLLKETGRDTPFILVTGSQSEEVAVECLKAGAYDYILKKSMARLSTAVINALEKAEVQRKEKAAETAFKLMFVSNPLPMWVYDLETLRFVAVNDRAISHYGYSKEEFLRMSVEDIRPEEDKPQFRENINRTRSSLEASGPWRHCLKNGNIIDVEIISHTLNFEGRSAILVVSQDITERKRAEDALKDSKERYRDLVENSHDWICTHDLDGNLLSVNEAVVKSSGYSHERLLKTNLRDLLHPSVKDQFDAYLSRLKSHHHASGIMRILKADGEPCYLEYNNTLRDTGMSVPIVRGMARDITERKKAEEALRASEEKYKSFFEDDLAGAYISTPDGRLLACNPAFVKMFGFGSAEEARKANLVSLYSDPDKRELFLKRVLEEKKMEYYETQLLRLDGKIMSVVENVIGKFSDTGELIEIKGYIFDDTPRKELEIQFIQSQKMESLGTLAGGIAHDFNNILSIILGHADLLKKERGDRAENISTIVKSVQRGAALVRQLLTFARKTEMSMQPILINEIIKDIQSLLRETFPKTIEISLNLASALPPVAGDATQIHQVFLNLCVNARDAMPRGGRLGITTNVESGHSIIERFPSLDEEKYVHIAVSDTGTGMDDVTKSKIFEPFFTTKDRDRGTGLGLATVYGIIETHRGVIDVESTIGLGTTFHIYFPVEDYRKEVRPRQDIQEEVNGGNETILVVDDEEPLRKFAQIILEEKGYRVLTAKDAGEALDVFLKHKQTIALVLCDLGLPKMSGEELFEKFIRIRPDVKVIMASGYIEPQSRSQLSKDGVKAFIQKPYDTEAVLRKIREVLDL